MSEATDPIEKEIQDKGLSAPRIKPADLEALVADELYCNGADVDVYKASSMDALNCLTLCVLVLKNGFTLVGKSACASIENFDEELGRKIARKNALEQLWPILGYGLRSSLSEKPAAETQPG